MEPEETVLWAGRPVPLIYAFNQGAVRTAFGLLFLVPCAFFCPPALANIGTWTANSIGLLTIGLLVVATGGWLLLAMRQQYLLAKRMLYVLTNKRAIVVQDWFDRTMRSHRLHDLSAVEIDDNQGRGNVIYVSQIVETDAGKYEVRDGFIAIDDPHAVAALMRTGIEASKSSAVGEEKL
jgi:hypothetical protein